MDDADRLCCGRPFFSGLFSLATHRLLRVLCVPLLLLLLLLLVPLLLLPLLWLVLLLLFFSSVDSATACAQASRLSRLESRTLLGYVVAPARPSAPVPVVGRMAIVGHWVSSFLAAAYLPEASVVLLCKLAMLSDAVFGLLLLLGIERFGLYAHWLMSTPPPGRSSWWRSGRATACGWRVRTL